MTTGTSLLLALPRNNALLTLLTLCLSPRRSCAGRAPLLVLGAFCSFPSTPSFHSVWFFRFVLRFPGSWGSRCWATTGMAGSLPLRRMVRCRNWLRRFEGLRRVLSRAALLFSCEELRVEFFKASFHNVPGVNFLKNSETLAAIFHAKKPLLNFAVLGRDDDTHQI